jgi:hypothetical protein
MNTVLFQASRRRLLPLVVAAVLALTGSAAPLLLDVVSGRSWVSQAYACPNHGGGCG